MAVNTEREASDEANFNAQQKLKYRPSAAVQTWAVFGTALWYGVAYPTECRYGHVHSDILLRLICRTQRQRQHHTQCVASTEHISLLQFHTYCRHCCWRFPFYRLRTEHLSWFTMTICGAFSMTFQDLVRRVQVLFNMMNATFEAHCCGTLYRLLCHFASNASVVTNANVLQI